MSVAEMKESIVKKVVFSDDEQFLKEVEAFINGKTKKDSELINAQEFQEDLFATHGEVLKRLA